MIVVIVGQTGTGKTKLSLELSKMYNAEIINADAVSIYKDVNIGSAKVKDKEGITHHLLDVKNLNDEYTIYDFQKDGRKIIDNLLSLNKNIVIVGGSGLYLKALLYDYVLEKESKEFDDYNNLSNEELKEKADSIYKYNNIHTNNRKRLLRFINHYNNTGKIIESSEKKLNKIYDFITIGLTSPRDILYSRINSRVDEMFDEGLLLEAKCLFDKGFKKLDTIIGYKELNKYFRKEITLEEAKYLIKQNTRRYAKRQETWFRHQMNDINYFNVDYDNFINTINEVKEFLQTKNISN